MIPLHGKDHQVFGVATMAVDVSEIEIRRLTQPLHVLASFSYLSMENWLMQCDVLSMTRAMN